MLETRDSDNITRCKAHIFVSSCSCIPSCLVVVYRLEVAVGFSVFEFFAKYIAKKENNRRQGENANFPGGVGFKKNIQALRTSSLIFLRFVSF